MVICLLFYYCYLLLAGAVSAVSGVTLAIYPAKISSQCDQGNPLQDEQLIETLRQIQHQLRLSEYYSLILQCFPSAPSGYYQIHAANGSAVQVYCDMEGTNCEEEGGWLRVAFVNMTQPCATCPQGLMQRNFPGLTLCGKNASRYTETSPGGDGCQGTVFSTFGLNYSHVCGQLRGYQFATPDAFHSYHFYRKTIDDVYVDGVSITYSSASRKHIWTYANGLDLGNDPTAYGCPCNIDSMQQVPPYIGSGYYCETGANVYTWCLNPYRYLFHPNDTLWDGQQCVAEETPCCTHPNMPWFLKTLSENTTEDIEVRMCGDENARNEDTPLQAVELFVY